MDITALQKKLDEQKNTKASDTNISKEQWQYIVTVENKQFKDLTGLDIKYMIFYKQEDFGSKNPAKVKHITGSHPVELLKAHEKITFESDFVKLEQARLKAGWYFTDGAKANATGALSGIWVRIYQGTTLVAEMCKPTNLSFKETWEQ
jgi:hypothetical protein